MEYGAIIWDRYNKSDINKLENLQRRGARFITKDYKSREEGNIWGGSLGGGGPPLKLEIFLFFLRKIRNFHTKYPKKFRASLRSPKLF